MKIDDWRERRELLLLKQKALIERLEEYIQCTSETVENCIHLMKTFEISDFNLKDLLIAKFITFLEEVRLDAYSLVEKLIGPIRINKSGAECVEKDETLEVVENLVRKSAIMGCFIQTQEKSDNLHSSDSIDELETLNHSDDTIAKADVYRSRKSTSVYIVLYSGEILDDMPVSEPSIISKLKLLQKESIMPNKPYKRVGSLLKVNKEDSVLRDLFQKPLKYAVYEPQLRKMVLVEKTRLILDICTKIKDWEAEDLLNLNSFSYLVKDKYVDIISLEDNVLIDYIVLYLKQKHSGSTEYSDFKDLFCVYGLHDLYFEINSMFSDAFSAVPSEKAPMILNYIFNLSCGYSKIIDLKDYKDSKYFYLLSWAEKYKY